MVGQSPDLFPLDFCLWGYLKSKVYSPCPATLNQLQANITREVAQLDPAMVRRAMLDMSARAAKCITTGGGRFEKQTSDYPFLVGEICCRFVTYVSFTFHTLVQEIRYMLSKSNTIWIYKKNHTVFPTNKSCIFHSCFPLNSVFF